RAGLDGFDRNAAPCPRPVVDDDARGIALHLADNQPRRDVGGAAGRKAHQDAGGLADDLASRPPRCGQQRGAAGRAGDEAAPRQHLLIRVAHVLIRKTGSHFSGTCAYQVGACSDSENRFPLFRNMRYCVGAPIATGRTGEPAAPWVISGRIMVQDSQTLSRASAPRLAFWMLWMPAWLRVW